MVRETFEWTHLRKAGSAGKITFRLSRSKFGDGYEQRVAQGLNHRVQTWPMTFEGDLYRMQPIIDFFDRHGGEKSFIWTPPVGRQGFYSVEEYGINSVGGGLYSVNADFVQVASP